MAIEESEPSGGAPRERQLLASRPPQSEVTQAISERGQSLDKLRAFTEQLEDSLEKAKLDTSQNKLRPSRDLLREISEQMPSAIETIRCALSDMTSLSNGIRTLSHLDTRPLHFEPLDCDAIVSELLRTNNLFIETNRVTVNVTDLPPIVADKQSIQDVFQGLFDNAMKYLDPARNGEIQISSYRDINYTTFLIADNGRGIHEDDFAHVFDVFKRSDEVVHISGEGMGIPYVQTLIRRHLGNLWFTSEYGVGTTFYFTIDNHLAAVEKKNEG